MVGGRFTTSKAPEAKRTSALEDLIRLKNEVESNKELKMASQARLINAKLQGKNLSKVSEQLSPQGSATSRVSLKNTVSRVSETFANQSKVSVKSLSRVG